MSAPAGEYPYPAAAEPLLPVFTPALPAREPFASLEFPVPFAEPETNQALLDRTLAGLKRIPRNDEVIFADAVADYYGTGASPVITQAPATAVPAASLADQRARYELAAIVFAAAEHAEPPYGPYCPDCKAADSGWCEACLQADRKAAGLYRLHDLILASSSFETGAALVYRSVVPAKAIHAEGQR